MNLLIDFDLHFLCMFYYLASSANSKQDHFYIIFFSNYIPQPEIHQSQNNENIVHII